MDKNFKYISFLPNNNKLNYIMYALSILFLLKVQKSSILYKQLNAIKYNPYIFLNNENKKGLQEPFFT
jgi:hypothetical protein